MVLLPKQVPWLRQKWDLTVTDKSGWAPPPWQELVSKTKTKTSIVKNCALLASKFPPYKLDFWVWPEVHDELPLQCKFTCQHVKVYNLCLVQHKNSSLGWFVPLTRFLLLSLGQYKSQLPLKCVSSPIALHCCYWCNIWIPYFAAKPFPVSHDSNLLITAVKC